MACQLMTILLLVITGCQERRPANAKSQKAPKKGYLNGYGRSSLATHMFGSL